MLQMGTEQYRLMELPDQIHQQSIKFLNEIIGFKASEEFRRLHKEKEYDWLPERVRKELRNLLEENVCSDCELLSGNWNDYILFLVDEVMGF
jgi:hypothetical protein